MLSEPARLTWSSLIYAFEKQLKGKMKHTGRKCPMSAGELAACKVSFINEGPMTLVLDSPVLTPKRLGSHVQSSHLALERDSVQYGANSATQISSAQAVPEQRGRAQQQEKQLPIEAVSATAGGALAAVLVTMLLRRRAEQRSLPRSWSWRRSHRGARGAGSEACNEQSLGSGSTS